MSAGTESGRNELSPIESPMPLVSFVVARTFPGNVIGRDNELPWKLSSDLRRFRRITTGHAVVMGAKTFQSIGRPLPDRMNVVLTRSANRSSEATLSPSNADVRWAASPDEALLIADLFSVLQQRAEFFVIGGAQIFHAYASLVDRIYLTEVRADLKGDAFFTMSFDEDQWTCVEQQEFSADGRDEFDSVFRIYQRRRPTPRTRTKRDFDRLTEPRPTFAASVGNAVDASRRNG